MERHAADTFDHSAEAVWAEKPRLPFVADENAPPPPFEACYKPHTNNDCLDEPLLHINRLTRVRSRGAMTMPNKKLILFGGVRKIYRRTRIKKADRL